MFHIKGVRNQLCFQEEESHAAGPKQNRFTEATPFPPALLQETNIS
jgi:hypothetical protein